VARISIPERHQPVFRQLLAMTDKDIAAIRGQIDVSDGRYQSVREVLAKHVAQAAEVVDALMSLSLAAKRLDLSESDVRAALETLSDDGQPSADLYPLVTARAIQILGKAFELRNGYERILLTSRIFSDIRPIFSDDEVGSIVESAMVNHTLQLTYQAGDRHFEELYLALDKEDLKKLKVQVDRALNKESAARAMIEKSGTTVLEPLEGQE
jgi:hypothetical protein